MRYTAESIINMNAWRNATNISKNQKGRTRIPPTEVTGISVPRYAITPMSATPANIFAKSRTERERTRVNSPRKWIHPTGTLIIFSTRLDPLQLNI